MEESISKQGDEPNRFASWQSKVLIEAARKLRIQAIDRLQIEVNELDARYDAIEDAEMAAGN